MCEFVKEMTALKSRKHEEYGTSDDLLLLLSTAMKFVCVNG